MSVGLRVPSTSLDPSRGAVDYESAGAQHSGRRMRAEAQAPGI